MMGMLDQLDLDTVKRLYRADLPAPVDVLNLIHFKGEEAYKWYGVLTLPLLKAVGAEVGWMGLHAESFLGKPRAEELLVVRCCRHRRIGRWPARIPEQRKLPDRHQQTLPPSEYQSARLQANLSVPVREPREL